MIEDSFFKVKPWENQREGARRASESPDGFGFFFEVGTGKTMTTVSTLRLKYLEAQRLKRTFILGPAIVLNNWKRELLFHSNLSANVIHVLTGSGKKRIQAIEKIIQDGQHWDEGSIIITNYEAIGRMKGFTEAILKWKPEILVLDESHRCKSIGAKQTREAIKIADTVDHSYLLTGTPILNSMLDIFSQFRILDKGATFGKQFYSFRGKYFYDKNSGMPGDKHFPNFVPRKGAAEEINLLIRKKAMYVEKDDCLDLPPLVRHKVEVEMSTEQEKAYTSMQKDFVAYIESEKPEAAIAELAITKALRLQQITTGFVGTEDIDSNKGIHKFKTNPRKNALKELLTDLAPKHKILVWAVFKENYNDIREVCEKLKIKYVEVHGGISQDDKMASVDKFNDDDTYRVFIGHPRSGGIGINLVPSDVSIFYSRNFSLENDIQAEARNYRGGSERHEKVTRIDIVTPGTIDEKVLEALASKKNIGYKVLREMVL